MIRVLAAAGVVFVAFGLPLDNRWLAITLLIACLWGLFSEVSLSRRRLVIAFACTVLLKITALLLPTFSADEGHNIFFLGKAEAVYSRALPPAVLARFKEEFLKFYPLDKACKDAFADHCMFDYVPEKPYAFAAEGIFRPSAMSRQVNRINFTSLESARISIINSMRFGLEQSNYNDFGLNLTRANTPFFVAYKFNDSAADGTLCWKGLALYVSASGEARDISHDKESCQSIDHSMTDGTFFALSVPGRNNLEAHFTPSPLLGATATLKILLGLAIVLLWGFLILRTDWKTLAENIGIVAVAGYLRLVLTRDIVKTFAGVYTQSYGDDGLTHQGFGLTILRHLLAGDVREALRGTEDLFYFMPGLRYFRALEAVVFGDTSLGYILVLMLFPLLIYTLIKELAGRPTALAFTAFFAATALPIFSYTTMMENVFRGYAEALGNSFFLIALITFMRRKELTTGLFCLGLAVFVRPNIAIAAGLVVSFMFAEVARLKRPRLLLSFLAFAPAGFCLAHNLYYGHEFVPLTCETEVNLQIPPSDYLQLALLPFAQGPASLAAATKIWHQFQSWGDELWYKLPLLIFAALAFYSRTPERSRAMTLVALACIGTQVVFLFFSAKGRYQQLAWILVVCLAASALTPFLRQVGARATAKARTDLA